MAVKLRVMHGTLRRRHGGSAGRDVKVRGERFVIGSGMDCQLRCPSSLVSPHHCEIQKQQDECIIRDLASDAGTFVNGERLAKPQPLRHGDVLRIGRLEFEVVMETAVPPPPPARAADAIGDRISEMLVDADREARAHRMEDPSARRFSPAPAPIAKDELEGSGEKKRLLPPKKNPPVKLPVPPPVVADSTVEAAEEVLKKFFEKPKR